MPSQSYLSSARGDFFGRDRLCCPTLRRKVPFRTGGSLAAGHRKSAGKIPRILFRTPYTGATRTNILRMLADKRKVLAIGMLIFNILMFILDLPSRLTTLSAASSWLTANPAWAIHGFVALLTGVVWLWAWDVFPLLLLKFSPKLTIHSAHWGIGWDQYKEVTDIIARAVKRNRLDMRVSLGPYLIDYYPNQLKYLKVVYSYGDEIQRDLVVRREGHYLTLPDIRTAQSARKLFADALDELTRRLNGIKRMNGQKEDTTCFFERTRDYFNLVKLLGESTHIVIDHWQLPNSGNAMIEELLLEIERLQSVLSPYARGERDQPRTSR